MKPIERIEEELAIAFPETIENIPSGALICYVNGEAKTAVSFSPFHLLIRSESPIEDQQETAEISFRVYSFQEGFRQFGPYQAALTGQIEEEFCYDQLFSSDIELFKEPFRAFSREYLRYIRLKTDSAANEFSEVLTGYPASLDEVFSDSFTDWNEHPIRKEAMEDWEQLIDTYKDQLELAVSLDTPEKCEAFLQGEFSETVPPVIRRHFQRLYIGSAWCHELFPDMKLLEAVIKKAAALEYRITIVLSYLRQERLEKEQEKIRRIGEILKKYDLSAELELNDWGYIALLGKNSRNKNDQNKNDQYENGQNGNGQNGNVGNNNLYQRFSLTFGVLLNRRRKDPRYPYKAGLKGPISSEWGKNALNDPTFIRWLHDLRIERLEQESAGYEIALPYGSHLVHSLHLPFYQTNTSQYCPLAALLTEGDRGKQRLMEQCPHYCKNQVILYPDHLSLIGRYNSIFSLDTWTPKHPEVLETYLKNGLTRIVWNW